MKKKNESGQSLIELALAISVLLLLVMGVMDFSDLFSTKMRLQNAVRQAARYATTGQCQTVNGTCSRYASIMSTVQTLSLGLANSGNTTITCISGGSGCPSQADGAGGPGDTVVITVNFQYHFMTGPIGALFYQATGSTSYPITVSAAFTNEYFPPNDED